MRILREELRSEGYIRVKTNRYNPNLKNQGFIDSIKREGSVRFLELNPTDFGLDSSEKLNMMKEVMIKLEIDVLLLILLDRR